MRARGLTVYAVALAGWVAVVLTLVGTVGWTKAADRLAVPVGSHVFGDMRIVLDGFDAANRGEDVLWSEYQPRDYFPVRFPYHRAWLTFRHAGVNSGWTGALSMVLAVLVLAHFGVLVAMTGNAADVGLALAAFAASPFMMLGFERGNPDLFLYTLLAAGCHLVTRSSWASLNAGAAVVFVAGILKFVPFGALLAVLPGDQSRRRAIVFVCAVAALVLFVIVDSTEILRFATAPIVSSNWASFGAAVSLVDLERASVKLLRVPFGSAGMLALRIAAILALLVAAWTWSSRLERHRGRLTALPPLATTGLVAGAAIFVSSFLVIRSYNYKIMFLAPAIPAVVILARRPDAMGIAARIAGIGLVVWLWAGLHPLLAVAVNALVAWPCVAAFGALLLTLIREPGLRLLSGRLPS